MAQKDSYSTALEESGHTVGEAGRTGEDSSAGAVNIDLDTGENVVETSMTQMTGCRGLGAAVLREKDLENCCSRDNLTFRGPDARGEQGRVG